MGVSYYSYAVLGCELRVSRLYKTVIEQHQEHNVPLGAKFCPVCGKPATTERDVPIFDEDIGQIGQFEIIWSTDRERAFVGLVSSDDDYDKAKCVKIEGLSELKKRLQDSLQPWGLWNEDKFGLYAVQYCSY